MKKIPFIYGKSTDFENFTDREEETSRLICNFKSLVNTMIISPRRWGKTSLIENVAHKMCKENDKIKICLLDICYFK